MPNGYNYDCGTQTSNYSTLQKYSGASYVTLHSGGSIVHPTFSAVSGYQTGYTTSKPNHDCVCSKGSGYGSLGCVYKDKRY